MILTGKVWKFAQDDINTGLIRKQMYNHLPPHEQGLLREAFRHLIVSISRLQNREERLTFI